MSIRAIRSDTEHLPCAVILLDHHPADSRTDIAEDQTAIQTLTSRMGTGGGNVPMILEPIPIEGNGARPSHYGNGYRDGGAMYSLNTTEVHAVAYTVDMGGGKSSVCTYEEQAPTLACTHYGEPAVAYTLKIRGGCDTYTKWDGKQGTAGKGALIQIEKSATLAASQDQYLFQPIDNTK